jgi:hypothetical protein
MNFIRFVKTPRLDLPSKKKDNVKKKSTVLNGPRLSFILTITTDFSPFPSHGEISCQLISSRSATAVLEHIVEWRDTDREVKVELPVPSNFHQGKLILRPLHLPSSPEAEFLSRYIGGRTSHIVGVETQSFTITQLARQDTVYRTFTLSTGPLRIAEQAGETIIRHVWDAGIILSAMFTYHSLLSLPAELRELISGVMGNRHTTPVRVLELGSGVGILGISLAATFPHLRVTMTDLADAESLIADNIILNSDQFPTLHHHVSFRELDWETRPFPEWTVQDRFEVIVMADVTYNTATFAPLAGTLEHLLRTGSKGAKVVCCGKRRHDEEEEFWRIIKNMGFKLDKRVVFSMDLEGNFRLCEEKKDGEQVVDFICISMP